MPNAVPSKELSARLERFFRHEWAHPSAWQFVLRPVAWLFGALVWLRRIAYRYGWVSQTTLPVPVIVVGNIAVGGSGKTPVVVAIAETLRGHGFHPGIVSRGYGRQSSDGLSLVVDPDLPNAATVFGDEPVLLARRLRCPVVVHAQRVIAAQTLLAAFPQTDVILCDDGLQHYALSRDVELAVVNAATDSQQSHLLPAGRLREPVGRLATVDAVLVFGSATPLSNDKSTTAHAVPRFPVSLGHESFVGLESGECLSPSDFLGRTKNQTLFAVAGIANPDRFQQHLKALGLTPPFKAFPDHHPFSREDLAAASGSILLMTEKDAVKCRGLGTVESWYLRVDAVLPEAFVEWLLDKLKSLRKSP